MTKRAIAGINIEGVLANVIASTQPTFKWVDPRTLLVDEEYQRGLSERSVRLIRKIVTNWDWARFKPPVVAHTDEGDEVLDGQHTAIAAASHPGIDLIPVMEVVAIDRADRARAFVGHNRDRLGISATQMHFSAVAAGDDDAVTINQVCARIGVILLKNSPPKSVFKPRESMAISAIGKLVTRRGAMGARKVLQVLAEAECAPISSDGIKAVEAIMYEPDMAGQVQGEDLTATVLKMGADADREAGVFAATHRVPAWRGLATVWFRNTRKRRKSGGPDESAELGGGGDMYPEDRLHRNTHKAAPVSALPPADPRGMPAGLVRVVSPAEMLFPADDPTSALIKALATNNFSDDEVMRRVNSRRAPAEWITAETVARVLGREAPA